MADTKKISTTLFETKDSRTVSDVTGATTYQISTPITSNNAVRQMNEGDYGKCSLLIYGLFALKDKSIQASYFKDAGMVAVKDKVTGGNFILFPHQDNPWLTIKRDDKIPHDKAVGIAHLLHLLRLLTDKPTEAQTIFPETKKKLEMLSLGLKSGSLNMSNLLEVVMDSYYYELKHTGLTDRLMVNEENPVEVQQTLQTLKGVEQEPAFDLKKLENLLPELLYQEGKASGEDAKDKLRKEEQEIFEKAKNGEFRTMEGEFTDQMNIPDLEMLEQYVPGKEFFQNLKRMKAHLDRYEPGKRMSRVLNMAFVGAPGTGKTYLCDILGATFGMPVYHMGCARHTEEKDFTWSPTIGEFGISQEATMTWNAFRNGGIIVLEEANLVDPGVLLGVFSKALENPGEIGDTEKNRTRRHPLCVVVLTMNPGATGTKASNEAFFNRFQYWTRFVVPTEDEELNRVKVMLDLKQDVKTDKALHTMYNIYKDIVTKTLDLGGTEAAVNVVSTRSLANCAEDELVIGSTRAEAVEATLLAPIATYIQQNYDEDTYARFEEEVSKVILAAISENGSYRSMKRRAG